jgi:hypothetical protein
MNSLEDKLKKTLREVTDFNILQSHQGYDG